MANFRAYHLNKARGAKKLAFKKVVDDGSEKAMATLRTEPPLGPVNNTEKDGRMRGERAGRVGRAGRRALRANIRASLESMQRSCCSALFSTRGLTEAGQEILLPVVMVILWTKARSRRWWKVEIGAGCDEAVKNAEMFLNFIAEEKNVH